MSTEHIDTLIRSAESDPALAAELRGAKTLDELVAIGAGRSLSFTREELETYLTRVQSTELSEQELSGVSGGVSAAHVAISMGDGRVAEKGPYLAVELKKVIIAD